MGALSDIRIEDHMPDAYVVAQEASEHGQRWFKRLTLLALSLLVVAALGGLVERSWGGWVSAIAFVASLVLTGLAVFRKTEQDWYDGRASAESIKSLTFKFAVGGEPFGLGRTDAEGEFERTLASLQAELESLGSTVPPPREGPVLGALRKLRAGRLQERRTAYRGQRLEEQRDWYAQRAREHRETARNWRGVLFASQAAGIAGAALKGLGVVGVDLMSIFAAGAAAAAAWLAAGDYARTARAYEFASLELHQAAERIGEVAKEEEWARFVADCEQAMSREHTMWLARRRSH